MDEECGNMQKSWLILENGLKLSLLNENLFIKAIKVDEKLGEFENISKLISSVESVPLDK
jgi:hypothetical protein